MADELLAAVDHAGMGGEIVVERKRRDGSHAEACSLAMSKPFATAVAREVVDDTVQIHGASGLEVGHPPERLQREVRAPRICEATSEIQRTIIAREIPR